MEDIGNAAAAAAAATKQPERLAMYIYATALQHWIARSCFISEKWKNETDVGLRKTVRSVPFLLFSAAAAAAATATTIVTRSLVFSLSVFLSFTEHFQHFKL